MRVARRLMLAAAAALLWPAPAQASTPAGSPYTHYGPLAAVSADSAKDVWAVGVNSVSAVSARDIWAVGTTTSRHVLLLHWNGTTWKPAPGLTAYGSLFEVAAASASDIWAFGASFGHPLIIRWKGGKAGRIRCPANLADLLAGGASSRQVWVTGRARDGAALVMRRTGRTWTETAVPRSMAIPYGVAVAGAKDAWVLGVRNGDGSASMHWNGVRWTTVPSPARKSVSSAFVAAAIIAPRDVWAVGTWDYSRRALIAHWNGAAWKGPA